MNSRQYAKMMKDNLDRVLSAAGIIEYIRVCLSADRTEYEILLEDNTNIILSSGFDYCED